VSLLAAGADAASVSVSASITAIGDVTLQAQAAHTVQIGALGSHTATAHATVDVLGAGTLVSGGNVSVSASMAQNVTALLDTLLPGGVTVVQTNTTAARVSGGAAILVTGADASLTVTAVDNSAIDISLAYGDASSHDLGSLFSNSSLNRTTSAEVSGVPDGGVTLTAASGSVTVAARQGGGIVGETVSGLVGSVENTAVDAVSAFLAGASVNAGGVTVSATSSGVYAASGRLASNTVHGSTTARIGDSAVSAGTGGVHVSALNDAQLSATSSAGSLNVGLDGITTDVSIDLAYARNALVGDTVAAIDGGSAVVATAGDVIVAAARASELAADAQATTVATTGALPGSGSFSLGGLLTQNQVLGQVAAVIEDSAASTLDSGSVHLTAADAMQVRATTALSATTDSEGTALGPTGVAGGVSVALNAIGWELPNTPLSIVNLLLGSGFGEVEAPQTVDAFIRNAAVDAAGDIVLTATSTALIDADVSDETDSSTSSLLGASSGAASAVFAGNKVSSRARAFVEFTAGAPGTLTVGGNLTLTADDSAGISAVGSLSSTAGSTSDLGTGAGVNLSDSDAIGVGGMVVRNDVRGGAEAFVMNAAVGVVGAVALTAVENATIVADIETTASASGGSAYGSGTVIAANGTIAVNLILSGAEAWVEGGSMTAGSLSLTASNTSLIDASVRTAANSGDTAVGVTIAFNTLGWESQDLLTQAADALLGNPFAQDVFGLESPAAVRAFVRNSPLDIEGDLQLEALSQALIDATVSNAADSTASAFYGATGKSVGVVIASNKVSSVAEAFVEKTGGGAQGQVDVGGTVSITAADEAGIYANSKLVSSSMTTNNGGASNLVSEIVQLVTTTNESGTLALDFGDLVRLEDDFGAEDFSTDDGEQDLEQYSTLVRLADDWGRARFTTEYGNRLLSHGDVIEVAEGYGGSSGDEGNLYRFVGSNGTLVDLEDQDFDGDANWVQIGGNAGSVYEYIGASETGVDLVLQNYGDTDLWRERGGTPDRVYEFMGISGTVIDLARENYADVGFWKIVPTDDLFPQGINFSESDSAGVGVMVVYNEVRSEVAAYARHVALDVGGVAGAEAVTVSALESATIRATADNSATSSGGSSFGTGSSLAANGTLATNVVLSSADAYLEDSSVLIGAGDLVLDAQNSSQIDAITKSLAASGEGSVGILLAFNTIGFVPQNLFFNTFDALLGISETAPDFTTTDTTPATIRQGDRVQDSATGTIYEYLPQTALIGAPSAIANFGDGAVWEQEQPIFNAERPSRVQAFLRNTTADVAGDISLSAVSTAQITARVSNEATSYPAAFFGAAGSSASGVLSSNKVSSAARAFIDFDTASAQNTVAALGAVSLHAEDRAGISADTGLYATVEPVNDAGAGLVNGFVSALLDDYRYTTESGAKQLKFGDRVLVSPGYDDDLAEPGTVYQYMGVDMPDGTTLALGSADYTNFDLWKELSPSNLITDSLVWAGMTQLGTVLGKEGVTGDAKSYYGLVDRNDVQSVVESFVENTHLDAASLTITAVESASIVVFDDSVVVSWEGGGGVIAINQVRSSGKAFIASSDVRVDGDLQVAASNVSTLDATVSSITEMWGSSTSIVAAFNSVGWDGGNVLFQAVDAILGTSILGEEQPAETLAYILDSVVVAGGDIGLSAVNAAQLNAELINESSAEAAIDLFFAAKTPPSDGKDAENLVAETQAVGGMLATNRVSSRALAFIDVSEGLESTATTTAVGSLSIEASDSAGIDAVATVVTMATSTNDLSGLVGIYEAVFLPYDYEYTTASGTRTVQPGDQVRVGESYIGSGAGAGGDQDSIYVYQGLSPITVDLQTTIFNDIMGVDGNGQPIVLVASPWAKLTGGAGDPADLYPNIGNLADSDAKAMGGLIILNDVRSDVLAFIDNAEVSADGGVSISALENATLIANTTSNVTASGGSAFGDGEVVAVNGQIATNLVLSRADAFIRDSVITTAIDGDVVLDARNTSIVDATINSAMSTGDKGLGITLAFNSIGWLSQNVLFNAIDAILGDPLLASAFGGEQPAQTQAYILNSALSVGGDLSLVAVNEAQLNATVSNVADSAASALYGANGKAGGGALASNKVSSLARAFIDIEEYQHSSDRTGIDFKLPLFDFLADAIVDLAGLDTNLVELSPGERVLDVSSGQVYEFTGLGVDSLFLDYLESLGLSTEVADDIEDIVDRLDIPVPKFVFDLDAVDFDNDAGWTLVSLSSRPRHGHGGRRHGAVRRGQRGHLLQRQDHLVVGHLEQRRRGADPGIAQRLRGHRLPVERG
jgi:hypothetical protein